MDLDGLILDTILCDGNRIFISKDNSTEKYIKNFESIKENGIDIELEDFQGNKFKFSAPPQKINFSGKKHYIPFTQDEVEMVIEDFKLIADINDLKLTNPFHNYRNLDTDLYYYQIQLFFDYLTHKDYVICIEFNTGRFEEELQSDLNNFIEQQRNRFMVEIEMDFAISFNVTSATSTIEVPRILIMKNKKEMKYLEKFNESKKNG